MSIQQIKYSVSIPQSEYDDLMLRLQAGEEVFLKDQHHKRSRIYLKDGKMYDTDRLDGKIDFDREVLPLPKDLSRFEVRSEWGRLTIEHGKSFESIDLGDVILHLFRGADGLIPYLCKKIE